MSMTSSDILDIRDCVKKVIERIKIKISAPVPAQKKVINAGEHFTFTVEASNQSPIAFKNVQWEVKTVSPDPSPIGCIIAPDSPVHILSSHGGKPIEPGMCYEKLVISYPEISPKSRILAEGTTTIQLEGIANAEIDDTVEGAIEARIYADLDLDYLFAFGSPSDPGEVDLIVHPK